MTWAAHRTRTVVGAFVAAASITGGLVWAGQQRRTGRIVREAVNGVLATDSQDEADAVVSAAMDRLRRSPSGADAMASVAGVGLLAHRRQGPADEAGDRGAV